MSQGKWACRPTPLRKSLRRIVAKRRKQRSKQWDWLQKQVSALFVTYAEPGQQEKEENTEERQGNHPWRFFISGVVLIQGLTG